MYKWPGAPRTCGGLMKSTRSHWTFYANVDSAENLLALAKQIDAKLAALEEKFGKKPNIVFIFIDDMGYGDIGPFGSMVNKTPELDRMAKEAPLFRDTDDGASSFRVTHVLSRPGSRWSEWKPHRSSSPTSGLRRSFSDGIVTITISGATPGVLFDSAGFTASVSESAPRER